MNIPIIFYDEQKAADAYAAYIGILAHEQADPTLADNPEWGEVKCYAFRRFLKAYTAGGCTK